MELKSTTCSDCFLPVSLWKLFGDILHIPPNTTSTNLWIILFLNWDLLWPPSLVVIWDTSLMKTLFCFRHRTMNFGSLLSNSQQTRKLDSVTYSSSGKARTGTKAGREVKATKSSPALRSPMDCSSLGFPVLHCLLELANSCPLSGWCYPTISSSVVPISSCPQSFLFRPGNFQWPLVVVV